MEETIVMLCVSKKQVDENPNTFIYPGSIETPCAHCGEPVFISPASQDAMKRATVITLCPPCFCKHVDSEKEPVDFQVLPKTAREVELWMRRRH